MNETACVGAACISWVSDLKKMYYIDHNYIASRNEDDLVDACLKRERVCCEAVPAFSVSGTIPVGHLGRRVWCIRYK